MVKYIKCPRCELNYIDSEQQEYCDVCLAELQGSKLKFADLDEDDEIEKTELCPVCGVNLMRFGEKMCDECKKNSEYEEDDVDLDPEQDDEWRNYLEDDADDLILEDEPLGLADELASEFASEFDEEEEDEQEEEESDDYEDLDYSDEDLDDLDEDDEDDEDEDDEDDDF